MPIAITDGLNIASPRDPVENKKLEQVIAGLKAGLEALEIPVTGGNVSLYNESPVGPIPPTPMVGSIGRIDKLEHVPFAHASAGDVVILWELQKRHQPRATTAINKPDILSAARLMSTSAQKRN